MTTNSQRLKETVAQALHAMGGMLGRTAAGHPSTAAGAFMLEQAQAGKRTVSPLKCIKLVYFAQGWMLGLHGRRLVNDTVMAYAYGPAMRDLYRAVRRYGTAAIPVDALGPAGTGWDTQQRQVMQETWDQYGHRPALELARMANETGSPWEQTVTRYGAPSPISNDKIEDWFANEYVRLTRRNEEAAATT